MIIYTTLHCNNNLLTQISSSSQRSSCASKAWAARLGKYLKNLVINWDASLFSLVDPLTADNISRYSGSF